MKNLESRVKALEEQAGMHKPRYVLLYTGCNGPPQWMIMGDRPDSLQDGLPELHPEDIVIEFTGNVRLDDV